MKKLKLNLDQLNAEYDVIEELEMEALKGGTGETYGFFTFAYGNNHETAFGGYGGYGDYGNYGGYGMPSNPIQLNEVTIHGTTSGNQNSSTSSLMHDLWNSDFMRGIVPDAVGFQIGGILVGGEGVGGSLNLSLITRGEDAGFHTSGSLYINSGAEASFGVAFFKGNSTADPNSSGFASYGSMMGWGVDGSLGLGDFSVGAWGSVNTETNELSWTGTSVGIGPAAGASGGASYTWPFSN